MKPGNRISLRIKQIICAAFSVCIILTFLLSCGLYAINIALKAPYNQYISDLDLKFTGDNEDNLEGYNLWYKKKEHELYKRFYYKGGLSTPTPTIPKKTGQTEHYTVITDDYAPQDSIDSFNEISTNEGTKFYFAVSAYGTGAAESGKVEFGIWPN